MDKEKKRGLLTTNELADRLNVSVQTVLNRVAEGRIPAKNVGTGEAPRWRFDWEEVSKALDHPATDGEQPDE